MVPDPDYIKKVLAVFQEAEGPTTDIDDLAKVGLSVESPELYFHLRLLNDQDFVRRDDDGVGIGVDRSLDGNYCWSAIPLRLTASGHEFAGALGNSKAMEKAKTVASFGLVAMRDIAVGVVKEIITHGGITGF
jgi:hypothetical protein